MSEVLAKLEKKGGGNSSDFPKEILFTESNRPSFFFKDDGTVTKYNTGATIIGEYLKVAGWSSSGYTQIQALQPGTYTLEDRYYQTGQTKVLTQADTFPYTLTTQNKQNLLFYVFA